MTWEPPSSDSRVDLYQYQLIDNLTEVIVSNTTNTTAVLSGIPYNVNLSFVISAHNCVGASQQVVLNININGMCTKTYDITILYTVTPIHNICNNNKLQ